MVADPQGSDSNPKTGQRDLPVIQVPDSSTRILTIGVDDRHHSSRLTNPYRSSGVTVSKVSITATSSSDGWSPKVTINWSRGRVIAT